jgi:sulfur carrier protein ThiS
MVAVRVRLNGPLAARLGPRITVELDGPATIGDLLAALGPEATGCAVHVGGRHAAATEAIESGAEVAVLAPYAGG